MKGKRERERHDTSGKGSKMMLWTGRQKIYEQTSKGSGEKERREARIGKIYRYEMNFRSCKVDPRPWNLYSGPWTLDFGPGLFIPVARGIPPTLR